MIYVNFQAMSPTTGFIYPGVKSAYAGNDANERGGVIAIYNENDVRLYGATNSGTELGKAYIINTGLHTSVVIFNHYCIKCIF